MANTIKPLERLAHFHRVDDCIYFDAVGILRSILHDRVAQSQQQFTTSLSNYQFDTLYEFLDQLEILYEHPRACSRRWRAFWREQDDKRFTVTSDRVERDEKPAKRRR